MIAIKKISREINTPDTVQKLHPVLYYRKNAAVDQLVRRGSVSILTLLFAFL
jgi:hypothetical protein